MLMLKKYYMSVSASGHNWIRVGVIHIYVNSTTQET